MLAKIIVDSTLCTLCVNLNFFHHFKDYAAAVIIVGFCVILVVSSFEIQNCIFFFFYSNFACLLLRSATSLRVQSVMNIFGWKIGVNKTNGHFYHSMSYQDHHPGFVIELPKQLTKALYVHYIAKR